ncbi:hypothetical protein [Actinomadura algeriensis]|uniref:Uncharacterized protein n=1 Tax=Actinomadura algeriensis TaxID=1679523 RepID=A0ABR9JQ56_9ACTN|nr:hypothetical protein [Actinomadura algeriensis]MBE1532516.1 hypothetical protein [Actinomadura algeriensis]
MPQTRPATSNGVVFALIMVGGALATGIAIVAFTVRNYMSPDMIEIRASTTYLLITYFLAGLAVGGVLLLTRPRGPLAPIGAAIAAFVAVEVGGRIGAYMSIAVSQQEFPGTGPIGGLMQLTDPGFMFKELFASLVAGGLALAKVLMSSGAPAPNRAPGGGMPGQPMPGQPMPGQPMPGQPFPGQPMPGQPVPGQPMPGQPYAAPGQPMPGQPMPGQPMPGQPMPGQPMPGQPMPGPSGWAPGQPIEPPSSPPGEQPPAAGQPPVAP